MAKKSNNEVKVVLTGDNTELQKVLQSTEKSLGGFGSKAGGVFGDAASTASSAFGTIGTAATGLGSAVAAAGIGIAATFSKINAQAEKAGEVFKSAALSGMGIEQIQRMANMYAQVGLNIEQIADHQKDLKDRLGDAITNAAGSMYTDIIEPLSLNIAELQASADRGEDVIAKIYYQAKQMGYSTSQMFNMMETIGNDAVLRIPVLGKFNDYQEYANELANKTVQLTSEQSAQFERYRTATNDLSNAWEAWNNNALAPVASSLASILNLVTQIIKAKPMKAAYETVEQSTDELFQQQNEIPTQFRGGAMSDAYNLGGRRALDTSVLKRAADAETITKNNLALNDNMNNAFKIVTDAPTSSTVDAQIKEMSTEAEKTKGEIKALTAKHNQTVQSIKDSLYTKYKGDIGLMNKDLARVNAGYAEQQKALNDKVNKDATNSAKKAASEQAKAAKEAAREKEKIAKETIEFNKLIAQTEVAAIKDSNLKQLAEFDRQQLELYTKLEQEAAKRGISVEELLGRTKEAAAFQREQMMTAALGITNPNQQLENQNALLESGQVSDANKAKLTEDQNIRIGYDDGMGGQLGQDQRALEAQKQQELNQAKLLSSKEEFEKKKIAIESKYDRMSKDLQTTNTLDVMGSFASTADSLANIAATAFGKQSGAAKAFLMVSKMIAIASATISINDALAKAMANGITPADRAAQMAVVATQGASIIGNIVAVSGQFHGGVDELPSSMDNKSFLLKAGERVVQPEANTKLTKFLDDQESGNGGGKGTGEVTINAPLNIVNQGGQMNDKEVDRIFMKHQNSVAQALAQYNKRNK